MPQYFSAASDLEIETTQDMNPHQPGRANLNGMARAHLTVYEAGEQCSATLPTIGDLLTTYVDRQTGLLSLQRFVGLDLKIDPAPLRRLDHGLRVSPGYSFVTHEARERAAHGG